VYAEPGRPTSVIAPAYHAYGGLPPADTPPRPSVSGSGFGGRRLILMAAGGLAAIVIGVVSVVALAGGSDQPKPAAAQSAQATQPVAPPPPSPKRTASRNVTAPSIDNEKTDRRPLKLSEVFPGRPLSLGGRTYQQDKTSVNHQCSLVARGAMAQALVRGHCRGVVRATYVDTKKRLAVTAGVVAMPTRKLALAARKAGDPSQYEWFRGMPGKVAKDIDQAGGYAASTVRGRYIIYSYTTYLGDSAGEKLLATVGKQFVAFAVRPIERRSQ
jgi:hypothetical protein